MPDSLSGVRLKIERARDQINDLERDISTFLRSEPYGARVHFDKATAELTGTITVLKSPDPMLGVRIGEIVHNLRSALDHVVWELVILNTGSPPRTKQNQFPVFETEAGFNDRGAKKFLHDVGSQAIHLIKSEQPFGTGEHAKSPLWHLKELSDVDKHRTLHVTGTLLQQFLFKMPPVVKPLVIETVEMRQPGPIDQDTVIWRARVHGATEWPFATREIHGHLAVNIAFDQRTPAVAGWLVVGTLKEVAARADRVIRRIGLDILKVTI